MLFTTNPFKLYLTFSNEVSGKPLDGFRMRADHQKNQLGDWRVRIFNVTPRTQTGKGRG